MNKYNFKNIPDRRNVASVKWENLSKGALPMWIADMDFETAPEIIEAMQKKVAIGAFGYEDLPDEFFEAIADWEEKEHNCRPEKDWITFVNGVIPALSSIVRRVTNPGDYILVQAPVYNHFYTSIENNGRRTISSDLIYNGEEYEVDWEDLERKLSQPLTTMMILCNPHNPIGYVWTKKEIERMAELCYKYDVILVSDEIHGDLVLEGRGITPAFSIDGDARNNTVSIISPSKTFNCAAIHSASTIIPGKHLRKIIARGFNDDEIGEPNMLAVPVTVAAYTQGHGWLAELKEHLRENKKFVETYVNKNIPELRIVPSTATYLIWIDVNRITDNSEKFTEYLYEKTGLLVSSGVEFRGNGKKFIRMNLACPLNMVKDGVQRLSIGVRTFK